MRVERVQEIREADALAEGVTWPHYDNDLPAHTLLDGSQIGKSVIGFKQMWDNINGKRGYYWSVNPYVYVIGFNRIPKP